MDTHVVGVLGGGQLGRMLVEAAQRLNIKVVILDAPEAPTKQIGALADHVDGSFKNSADVRTLRSKCDVITYEIEHVDVRVLEELEIEEPRIPGLHWSFIQPHWRTVKWIQDRYRQKQHYASHGVPTADSAAVGTSVPQGLLDIANQMGGFPLMLKTRRDAYDGRGNYPLRSVSDIEPALKALKGDLYVEKWVNFKMELSVMVAKTSQDCTVELANSTNHSRAEHWWRDVTHAYPAVETIHEDSICKLVYAPARSVATKILIKAQDLARRAVATFLGTGVFGVEMFLLEDDSLIINEIAPRPHNSAAHYVTEACHMSQYEAHLRAILPNLAETIAPGATDLLTPDTHAVVLNILGGPAPDSHLLVAKAALRIPGAKIHLYGKGDGTPGHKMGHITLIASSMEEAETKIQPLITWVDAVRAHKFDMPASSDSDSAEAITETFRKLTASRSAPVKPKPVIGVTMGSDSDLPVLRPGLAILNSFNIPYEVTITSAHRTPGRMLAYAQDAASRGLKVIIAAAGGAAHLPGMLASSTPLPVIGVPVKGSSMDGMDSLLSIVQMPRGVPVACVAVNNSTNAALLALRILGVKDKRLLEQMDGYMKDMESGVVEKAEKLEEVGWEEYSHVIDAERR
jgi:phosphoribosylaminoimidazole carboxylase